MSESELLTELESKRDEGQDDGEVYEKLMNFRGIGSISKYEEIVRDFSLPSKGQ